MRTLSKRLMGNKVKMETDRYLEEKYDELCYGALVAFSPNIIKQTEAILLYALSKHGYGEKRLNEIHSWFKSMVDMPDFAGKEPKCTDALKFMHEKYNINFDDIIPRMMTFEEFVDTNNSKEK